jgi:Txe/YoeB family toxin of Txe-Axe toxin-antitoxin module
LKPSEIQFANEKVKNAFNNLSDKNLKKFLERALNDIKSNPFCGIQIPKKLIPKDYIKKFDIHNIWKYNLPEAWRLIYSIKGGNVVIITIILEWMDHKEYERRFKY